MSAGNSDHLGIVIKKFTKFPVSKPQSVKKLNYEEFNVESFLTEIYKSEINTIVTRTRTIDAATEVFENIFKHILNEHVYHMRKKLQSLCI